MTAIRPMTGLLGAALLSMGGWVTAAPANAADTIVLTYGLLSLEVPMAELETFSDTGTPSGDLAQLMQLGNQDPDQVRTALNQPVSVSPVVLDLALNTPPGEWMLDRISETIQPASGQAGRQALRSALIGAASNDQEITLLEVMRLYPSSAIVVKGDRLMETYNRLYELLAPFEDLAEILGSQ